MAFTATFNGNSGNITATVSATTVILNPNSFTFTMDRDVERFTIFGSYSAGSAAASIIGGYDSTEVSFSTGVVLGGCQIKGSANGLIDVATVMPLAATPAAACLTSEAIAFVLTTKTSRTFTFTGAFTNFKWMVKAGTAGKWTGSFESNGTITVA